MADQRDLPATIGTTIYNEDGQALGIIRGFDGNGFYVTTEAGMEAMSVEHEHPGPQYGEAELMWRCSACGAMGDIDDMPERCPDCEAPREDIYYWTED
ncbi:MAG: rubredoxin-like domain-containing protein [Halobacteriaceae archaeon]